MALAAAISGAAMLGGSVLSGALNSHSQKEANDTNLQVARENNQFNQQMWENNNAYNSPKAMVQRDLDAGLNPYLQSTQVGNATSQPVTASPVQPVQSTREGDMFAKIPDIANSMFNNYMNQQLTVANVAKAKADAISAMNQARASASLADLNAANKRKVVEADIPNVQSITENNRQQNELLQLQTQYDVLRNEIQQKFGSDTAQKNLELLEQHIAKVVVDKNLTNEQIANVIQDTLKKAAEERQINFDVFRQSKLLPYEIAKFQLTNTYQNLTNQLVSNDVKFQNSVTMPDNTFGSRMRAAGLESKELSVQIQGLNVDKTAAEINHINQQSKLVKKDNDWYFINAFNKMIPAASVLIK